MKGRAVLQDVSTSIQSISDPFSQKTGRSKFLSAKHIILNARYTCVFGSAVGHGEVSGAHNGVALIKLLSSRNHSNVKPTPSVKYPCS